MKSIPKKILSLFLSLLMLLSVTSGLTFTSFADDEIKTYGEFEYKTDGSDIYIYQYTGTDADVVIPSEIDGMKVTVLGGYSHTNTIFDPEAKIRSVTIPETVTDVFVGAVINPFLKNIYVDENNAVYRSEDGVLFNKDMTEIITSPSAKSGSYSLPEFNVDKNNSKYISVDGVLYSKDMTTLVAFPNGNPDDITKSAADINSDGKVTSAEARNILRFAARLAKTIDG